jgi:acyl-CoA synthetase (NDP forming)
MKTRAQNLDSILFPRPVAVVGASNRPGRSGLDIFRNILKSGFQETLYPANPKSQAVKRVKPCLSGKELPDQVDPAIVIVPPKAALANVNERAATGMKGVATG